MRQRTMLVNALRGHLSEFGIVVAKGIQNVQKLVAIVGDFRNGPFVVKLQSNYCRCQALTSCPWSTKRSPTSCDPIQSGANLWDTWYALKASDSPVNGFPRSYVPAAGPSGVSAVGATPNSVTLSDVKGLKLPPIVRSCG